MNRQCIIDVPKDCMYLALSYVWGQGKVLTLSRENRIALGREGGLESAMDRTSGSIRYASYKTMKRTSADRSAL